jgi:hypothetical protein
MRSSLRVLPLVGGGSLLLAHLLMAAAFRRRTDAMIARLEQARVTELSIPLVPAIVQSFARRAVREMLVPDTVWLRQSGEMRANLRDPWRPFTAEQVISIHQPGFVWLGQMLAAPLSSARVLDCYVDGKGLLEARLFGSLRLTGAAGPQADKGESMRLSCRARMGAARDAAQPAAVLARNRCDLVRSIGREPRRPSTGTADRRER